MGEDRISALPDCLLLEILDRLPFSEDAIRTGALSKRWQHLWTSVPTLIFSYSDSHPPRSLQNPKSRPDFVSFVDKTLTQRRQLKLKKFNVWSDYDSRFERQFNNWIHYAIRCNVEELDLVFWFWHGDVFALDQFFFISSCFTYLRLSFCILKPTGAISWKNLRRLCIYRVDLDEDLIENILSGSSLLETLELGDCYGTYRWLNITSKSVKNLVFFGYSNPDDCDCIREEIIQINAPNILSLTFKDKLFFGNLWLENVSSVVEANLNYYQFGYMNRMCNEAKEEILKGFILQLSHVKELKIGYFCSKVVSRLGAKGFVFPSNVKFVKTRTWFDSDSFETEDL